MSELLSQQVLGQLLVLDYLHSQSAVEDNYKLRILTHQISSKRSHNKAIESL